MTLLIKVNKNVCNVAIIDVITKVVISKVFISIVVVPIFVGKARSLPTNKSSLSGKCCIKLLYSNYSQRLD